jgi:hypothetical protein
MIWAYGPEAQAIAVGVTNGAAGQDSVRSIGSNFRGT